MKFVAISDTHGQHADLELPEADCIIHAGDVSKRGTFSQVQDFLYWFEKLDYKYKIFIAGNHDFCFEKTPSEAEALILENIIYLNDSGCEIEGIKIWGSPVTPWFHDWAFNRERGSEIKQHWDLIPNQVDILITHGPVHGILDRTVFFKHAGCEVLKERVNLIRPKIHISGHIHEGYGEKVVNGIHYMNASVLNFRYKLANKPIVFDVQDCSASKG